jgi:hypothetical protein
MRSPLRAAAKRLPAAAVALSIPFALGAAPDALAATVTLKLVNASTGASIQTLTDGVNLDTAALPKPLDVQATSDTAAKSYKFCYDGTCRVENTAPYTLDDTADTKAWAPTTGAHTLIVSAHSATGATGTTLVSRTLKFTVGTPAPAPAPAPAPTTTAPAPTTTAPISGKVLVAPDWRGVADNTYAPSLSNSSPKALPGLKDTDWNIRPGGPFARIETVDGRKALHFHVPANYSNVGGDTANAGRAEQEPNVPSVTPGQTVYWAYDFKAGAYPSRPSWNLSSQFKNDGTGSPPFGIHMNSNQAGAGIRAFREAGGENHLLTSTTNVWHRIIMRFTPAKAGATGSIFQAWVDGVQVANDTSWTGGLIMSGKTSAYLKFGIYGSTVGFARDHYFANMVVGTSYDAVVKSPYGV